MFVSEAIEGRAGGMVGRRLNDQDGAPPAVIIQLPATADDAFAVLPQDLRIAVGVLVIQRVRHHLSASVYATRSKPLSPSGNLTASPGKCQPSIDLNGSAVRGSVVPSGTIWLDLLEITRRWRVLQHWLALVPKLKFSAAKRRGYRAPPSCN